MENNETPSVTTVSPAPIANKPQITTPTAILVAGVLIMIAIFGTKGGGSTTKTLSEQVGVSNASLQACIKATDTDTLSTSIDTSVNKAMSAYAPNERGTPYSVVIGPNGFMTDIRGAESYNNVKLIVDYAMEGKLATEAYAAATKDGPVTSGKRNLSEIYKGNIVLSEPSDHVTGNPSAKVTIIEYSDFECPYCKQFHPVLEQIVKENPDVQWIYRNYPLHQHSFAMLSAAECVNKLKGNDAYWKYADLLFGLQDKQDTISGKL